ncbi:MAG: sulfotransferase [Ardenticatenaceae bacterium]|nr:sulfotransferase [Ardenticatenaceae bacterium]
MLSAFILALVQWFRLLWWSATHLFFVDQRAFPKRLVLFVLGVPLFGILQLIHWLGFLADEVFFPGYRQIEVEKPVFIVGIPRSGTTFLQRTLADDPQFTTTKAWECIFAPSITERTIYHGLGRLFAPFGRLLPRQSLNFFNKMESIHELGLQEPEEDFLFFLPLFSCFILIAIFPEAAGLWRQAQFDLKLTAWEKETTLSFYHRCVQKHLYFHGRQRRYLSKNPSFSSMLRSLHQKFPDGKFVVTIRPPQATVPSQLSSLRPTFELVGSGRMSSRFQTRIVEMLHFYYQYFAKVLPTIDDQIPVLENKQIKLQLAETLEKIYAYVEQPQPLDAHQKWAGIARESTQFKSKHRYQLDDFGLEAAEIKRQFVDVWPMKMNGLSGR